MFGPNQIYPKLKAFKSRLQPVAGGALYVPWQHIPANSFDDVLKAEALLRQSWCPSLFRYNRTDKAAPDIARNSIRGAPNNYTSFVDFFWNIHLQDAYTIQRYGQVRSTAGRIQRSYLKKAVPEGDTIPLTVALQYSRYPSTRWTPTLPWICCRVGQCSQKHRICWSGTFWLCLILKR